MRGPHQPLPLHLHRPGTRFHPRYISHLILRAPATQVQTNIFSALKDLATLPRAEPEPGGQPVPANTKEAAMARLRDATNNYSKNMTNAFTISAVIANLKEVSISSSWRLLQPRTQPSLLQQHAFLLVQDKLLGLAGTP